MRFAPLALIGAALVSLSAAPLSAAPARRAAPAPAPAPLPDTVQVVLTTELGPITVALDGKNAPVSTRNFLAYVDGKRFDGVGFYRAMHLPWGDPPNGLIQAGPRGDPKRVLKPIAHEPTSQTGLLHKAGALSMARFAPGTATGDFSILLSDMPGLDADAASADPERRAGYAVFGHVVSGMDVVRQIWDAPLSPTAGEGALKGQLLIKPVRILTARRVAPSSPQPVLPGTKRPVPQPPVGSPSPQLY